MGTHERSVSLHIDGFGEHIVRVPARQAGVMSVIGYFSALGRHYVIKLLRVPGLRPLFPHVAQPAYARILAHLTVGESWYAPGPDIEARVRSQHAQCMPLLRHVDGSQAYVALRGALHARRSEVLNFLNPLYRDRDAFDFAPAVSVITDVTSPDPRSSRRYLALVQDDIGAGAVARAATVATGFHADPLARQLLLLLALAHDIARRHGIGLDLVPRVQASPGPSVSFPNVLTGPTAELTYVDFFALGAPDGYFLERLGQGLLYGRWSSVAVFTRWLFARESAALGRDHVRWATGP